MCEVKIIKTPWYKIIKVNKRIKKWNKKYGDRPMTVEEIEEAIRDY